MPYIDQKKYVKLTGTIAVSNTNIAHGLGTVPDLVFVLVTGSVAGVVRLVSKDGTNLTLISTIASTTVEVVAFE